MLNILANLLIMVLMILVPTLMCILIAKKPAVAVGLLAFMVMYYVADGIREANFGDLSGSLASIDMEGNTNAK